MIRDMDEIADMTFPQKNAMKEIEVIASQLKLGEILGLARELRGMTLRELEDKAGVSNALISQIETGKIKDPGFSTVVRLALALDVPIERCARPYTEWITNKAGVLRKHGLTDDN